MYEYTRFKNLKIWFSFQNLYAAYQKKLKAAGKGETDSHEVMPDASMEKIFETLRVLQNIMQCKDKNAQLY